MNTSVIYFPISAIFNALVSTFFGIYLLCFTEKNERKIAGYLIYLCSAVAVWSFGYLFWQTASNAANALFWARFLMTGAIFTALSYYHFVLVYLGIKNGLWNRLLVLFYILAAIWLISDFTPYFVKNVIEISYFKFWPLPGPFFHFFLITFFAQVFCATALLFKNFYKVKGLERKQTVMLLMGLFLAFLGGSTNFFLWYKIPIAPWGNIFSTVYVFLTVYAAMRYGLLKTKVLFADLFAACVVLVALIDIFFAESLQGLIFRCLTLIAAIIFGWMLTSFVRGDMADSALRARMQVLEETNQQLKELDRQKTEFLNIAAHQLRTPVSIINNYVAMLEDGDFGEVNNEVKQVHKNIGESNQWLVRLADEFLNIAHLEQGETKYHKSRLSVGSVIQSVIKELLPKVEKKNLRLIPRISEDAPDIIADEEKIRHVLFNFVDNAIKYSDEGDILIIAEKKDNGVSVIVKDSGMGFGEEDRINLFQKFHRGKNASQVEVNTSSGLGLYICRKFVEGHKGRVWAKSPGEGQGSEFGFWTPVA